jgi:hypothetical protein
VIGIPIEDARTAWEAAGFDPGLFSPAPPDDEPLAVVTAQSTVDASVAGVTCMPDVTTISVVLGEPWGSPPDQPCLVPNLVGSKKNKAQDLWDARKFTTDVELSGGASNWTIAGQSLNNDTYQDCDVAITVYENP